jgi:putative acyl-CoA dehydrogenase
VSDAFIASRLATSRRAYGTLPRGIALPPILDRSSPD